jgi:hypothetical protein
MKEESKLKLEWKKREGGDGRTQRDYLDIVVDGRPLSEMFGGDMASCLGWLDPEANAGAVRRLLLEEAADLPNDRRTLYVCPECGDAGCGVVSLVVGLDGDKIVWRDFGYENNYEGVVRTEGFEGVGPFVFKRAEYERALRKAL